MSTLIAVLVSIGSMVYWDLSYVPSSDYDWRPIDDLLSVLVLMPFGWFIAVLTPIGWLSIAGYGLAVYRRSFKPLVLSFIAAVVFGLIWPWYSVAMQGI